MEAGDSRAISVWSVRLSATESVNREYRELLSSDEIERADRFVFEHLTRSYELSHGALRLLLARALDCPPREIEFDCGPRGKPFLRENSHLKFNMAHSGDLALYAFLFDIEIGADVEEIRDVPEIEKIAARFFCSEEAKELKQFGSGEEAVQAFFRCWTRKEAYIKAVGDGLFIPLDRFQVSLAADEPARFLHIDNDATAANEWTLHHLDPAPNYVGALAYPGAPRTVHFHELVTPQELLNGIANRLIP
ncbi:MAG TPA: 4'-phosphopantetheinyl transferase superfamily protein [Bryobacteraceae bacterium]|nr:4'-phosphopantetheinyl transferase superfamily protein [Bryobacteraceae bacterium]